MKCPECQFDNREEVKFCEECGAKFELECPSCKANIPPEVKFCEECGAKFELECPLQCHGFLSPYPLHQSPPGRC